MTYTEGSQKLVIDYSPKLEGLQPDMPHYRSVPNEILDALERVPASKDWR